jgi:hypothetical protein
MEDQNAGIKRKRITETEGSNLEGSSLCHFRNVGQYEAFSKCNSQHGWEGPIAKVGEEDLRDRSRHSF